MQVTVRQFPNRLVDEVLETREAAFPSTINDGLPAARIFQDGAEVW